MSDIDVTLPSPWWSRLSDAMNRLPPYSRGVLAARVSEEMEGHLNLAGPGIFGRLTASEIALADAVCALELYSIEPIGSGRFHSTPRRV